MNRVIYLVERVQQEPDQNASWWIGESDNSRGKFTSNFHEIPEAYRFPTRWHALAVLEQYRKFRGDFPFRVEITDHSIRDYKE